MAMLISKYWNPTNLLSIWSRVRASNFPKPLSPLFPYKRTVEDKIKSIKGYKNSNVILNVCDPDSKATIRGSRKLTIQEYEIPEFREGIILYNSEVREISRYIEDYGASPESLAVLDQKYREYLELMNGIATNAEFFRAQLLQYAKFQFRNRVDDGTFAMVEANFDVDREWENHNVVQGMANLTDPASDALADINNLIDQLYIQNDGEVMGTLIMNTYTWNLLKRNDKLGEWLFNMRRVDPRDYFSTLGVNIMIDNTSFQTQLADTTPKQKYIEDGNICIVPNQRLGHIVCSESDLFRDMLRNKSQRPDIGYDDETGAVVRCVEYSDPDKIKTTIEAHIFPAFDTGMMEKCCVLRGKLNA